MRFCTFHADSHYMNTKTRNLLAGALLPTIVNAQAKVILPTPPAPLPPPVIRIVDLRADEKPVEVVKSESTVAENAFFRRVKAGFTFTNPNARVMAGEFEFPIPDGAFVCGYALELNGEMVPGVVCEKEKARVAFENEMRKGVDPGIVEQVKGNVWKTRIFPLNPKTPRKAEVEYIAPKTDSANAAPVFEKDGDDYFVASVSAAATFATVRERIANFTRGVILWDASMSAKPLAVEWRKKLEALPEKGEWTLVAFRNVPEEPRRFSTKSELIAAVDALFYDGGTDIGRAIQSSAANQGSPTLLFSDEVDTLGLKEPQYEGKENIVIASRDDVAARAVEVKKLAKGQEKTMSATPVEGRILATVWAARRMQDLASQADARKDEFLSLGRKYGVAGPGLSLIVLENLNQWLEYKIEPPASLAIHAEWVKRRAAEDDPIAEKKAKAEHEQRLLQYWEERVKWWKDPKPPRPTPKSGLFDTATVGAAGGERVHRMNAMREEMPAPMMAAGAIAANEARAADAEAPVVRSAMRMRARSAEPFQEMKSAPGAAGSGTAPTVTLKAWDPKTPYIDALNSAKKGEAYAAYLNERDKYATSPAFYLDCAGWFFKAGEMAIAERILSNLAEFKLEDAALWRSMGWRAREAGKYNLAVLAFRKALLLRGEESQSRRDLALVLMEQGKELAAAGAKDAKECLEEAMKLFAEAAFRTSARRSGRRGNDFQVSVVALEELNGLISWANAREWPDGAKPKAPEFDAAYRRDLPMKLRIVMSWDADETDIDLHVLEPNGDEAFYRNRRTAEGGFVSEDVTTGYGPEEYLKKELEQGTYKVLSNYFASHQTALTGATTVTATVYTDWGTAQEKRQVLTLRLDKPKQKHLIGEVTL